MIINFVTTTSRATTYNGDMSKLINSLANELAAKYDVRDNLVTMYFLRDPNGQELFAKYLKDEYNVTITFWCFGSSQEEHPLAAGIDILEDGNLTKLLVGR
jgi:hypothetical protein